MDFTGISFFKSDPSINLDVDSQITMFISYLDGSIKPNWKIIAPTPESRIIYFEMEAGVKPELVTGYREELRSLATGEAPPKIRRKRNGKNNRKGPKG